MRHPNLSIGDRMAAGFGLLLLTLIMLIAAVFHWHASSAGVQAEFTERMAPLAERANTLERSVLHTGIALRAYLLAPDAGRLEEYRRAGGDAQAALEALRRHPKDAESEARFRELQPLVERYIAESGRLLEVSAGGSVSPQAEAALSQLREAAASKVNAFSRLQAANAAAALATMAKARERVSEGLIAGSIIAALLCLAFAYFTARSIKRPAGELLRAANALLEGDWRPALAWKRHGSHDAPGQPPVRNEMLRIGHAFGEAAAALERREQRLNADRQIASAAAASLDRAQVADAALRIAVEHAGAQIGVLYCRIGDSDSLAPVAQYALAGDLSPVRIGEGLPGEAARQGRTVIARDIPADSALAVKLGYDQAPPRAVAAVPVLFRGDLLGVLVLATLRDFDADAVSFLDFAATELGIGLENVRAYEQIRQLLAEMQQKNERIRAQNQELQAQNEEIQAQSEEIQAQHEEIQAQSEELQSQNEQLRQHADELQSHAASLAEADRRKNEFLGFLAHELRNPMAAIANSLFILREVQPGSDRARTAQTIMERQAKHLTRLIDDLLDITRISHGKIELERQPMELVCVVRECIADYQSAFEGRRLRLDVAVPERDVWVDGDRTRLCQVLGNLLSNATKFTGDGGRVSVELNADRAAGLVELSVADTGAGIEPELMERLFQPFSQGASGPARSKGGLGLGLALVKTIVELHGGSVRAQSEGAGRGARFVIRLPLGSAPARSCTTAPASHKTWRMLIVEDNADAAVTLRAAAELHGHDVEVAASGSECLDLARRFQPEVVLCDLGLPDMDGYEVARRFREDQRLRAAHLIAVSGYAAERDRERASAAGFDRHLAKPLSMEALAVTLAELDVPETAD